MEPILTTTEIEQLERDHASGVPARAILEVFQAKGWRLSEATFRKYVQAGLLPRSRRIGRKGLHQGSQGLYPVSVMRQLVLIRKMMAEGLTLEQIRGSFFAVRGEIDALSRAMEVLLGHQDDALRARPLEAATRQELEQEIEALREDSRRLIRRIERLASLTSASGEIARQLEMQHPKRGKSS